MASFTLSGGAPTEPVDWMGLQVHIDPEVRPGIVLLDDDVTGQAATVNVKPSPPASTPRRPQHRKGNRARR